MSRDKNPGRNELWSRVRAKMKLETFQDNGTHQEEDVKGKFFSDAVSKFSKKLI